MNIIIFCSKFGNLLAKIPLITMAKRNEGVVEFLELFYAHQYVKIIEDVGETGLFNVWQNSLLL